MNLYLKLFLAFGIPFGILMGAATSFLVGLPVGLIVGLLAGLFAGGLFSFIMGYLHQRSVRRMPYGERDGAMEVRHVRRVELRLPYDQAFVLCTASLNGIKRVRIRREARPLGRIEARAGMTLVSWGEVISFDLRGIDENRTWVEVSSRTSPAHNTRGPREEPGERGENCGILDACRARLNGCSARMRRSNECLSSV